MDYSVYYGKIMAWNLDSTANTIVWKQWHKLLGWNSPGNNGILFDYAVYYCSKIKRKTMKMNSYFTEMLPAKWMPNFSVKGYCSKARWIYCLQLCTAHNTNESLFWVSGYWLFGHVTLDMNGILQYAVNRQFCVFV